MITYRIEKKSLPRRSLAVLLAVLMAFSLLFNCLTAAAASYTLNVDFTPADGDITNEVTIHSDVTGAHEAFEFEFTMSVTNNGKVYYRTGTNIFNYVYRELTAAVLTNYVYINGTALSVSPDYSLALNGLEGYIYQTAASSAIPDGSYTVALNLTALTSSYGTLYTQGTPGTYTALTAGAPAATFTLDRTAPAVTVVPEAVDPPSYFTIDFGEALGGMNIGGITVLLDNVVVTGDFTFALDPSNETIKATKTDGAALNAGTYTIRLASDSFYDLAGNKAAGDDYTFTVDDDGEPYIISHTPTGEQVLAAAPSVVEVVFNEDMFFNGKPLTAVYASDWLGTIIATTQGEITGVYASDNKTIYIDLNGIVGGEYTISFNGLTDKAGNSLESGRDTVTFTVDAEPLNFIATPSGLTNDADTAIVIKPDKELLKNNGGAITGDLTDIFTVTDANGNQVSFTGAWDGVQFTLTPDASLSDGTYTVTLRADKLKVDNTVNAVVPQQVFTFAVDATAPEASISPADGTVTESVDDVTITFNEIMYNASGNLATAANIKNAVSFTGGSGSNVSCTIAIDNSAGYTVVTLTPVNALTAAGSDYTVAVNAWLLYDEAGNELAQPATSTFTIAKNAPVPTFDPIEGAVVTSDQKTIMIDFYEDLYDVNGDPMGFAVTGGISVARDGSDVTGDMTVTYLNGIISIHRDNGLALQEGYYVVTVEDGTFYDYAGNEVQEISSDFTVNYDGFGVTFELGNGGAYSGSDLEDGVTLTFSKTVYKAGTTDPAGQTYMESAIKLYDKNGQAVEITVTRNGKEYTVEPAGGWNSGSYTLTLRGNMVSDIVGNAIETDQSITFTVDNDDPYIQNAVPADGSNLSVMPIEIKVLFSEEMYYNGVSLKDLSTEKLTSLIATNLGAITGAYTADGEVLFIYMDGTGGTYELCFVGLTDAVGNPLPDSETITYNISTSPLKFSVSPQGLTSDSQPDITITPNKTLVMDSGNAITSADLTYIFTITDADGNPVFFSGAVSGDIITLTPSANLPNGAYTVTLNENMVKVAGTNTAVPEQAFTFTVDATEPEAIITPRNGSTVKGDVEEAVIYLSEAVYRSNLNDLTETYLLNAVTLQDSADVNVSLLSAAYDSVNHTITYTFERLANDTYTLTLKDGVLSDKAGNVNDETVSKFKVSNTETVITFDPENGSLLNTQPGTITVTFSQIVLSKTTGTRITSAATWKSIISLLDADGSKVSGVTVASIVYDDVNNETSVVLNTVDLADGSYTIRVNDDALVDAARSTVDGDQAVFTLDTTAPSVKTYPSDGMTVDVLKAVDLVFSEIIYNAAGNPITDGDFQSAVTLVRSSDGTVIATTATVSHDDVTTAVLSINAPSKLADGDYTVMIPADTFYDKAGNDLAETTPVITLAANSSGIGSSSVKSQFSPVNGSVINIENTASFAPMVIFSGAVLSSTNNTFNGANGLALLNDLVQVYRYNTDTQKFDAYDLAQVTDYYVDANSFVYICLDDTLWPDGTYRIAFEDAAFKTVAGETLEGAYTEFTIDTVRPIFVSANPADGADVMASTASFSFTSSELLYHAVSQELITKADVLATAKITDSNGNNVKFTVEVSHDRAGNSTTITLTPATTLDNDTYTISFETATNVIVDVNGNPLAADQGYTYHVTSVTYGTHDSFIVGYPDGTFKPDNSLSRAEAAAIVCNIMGDKSYGSKTTTFSDVSSSDWFYGSVMTLATNGIISGYPDGTFRPQGDITRAEFAAMLVGYAGITVTPGNPSSFSDVYANYWAVAIIEAAYTGGIISGYPNGTFKPDQLITRAEAVCMVNKMTGRDCGHSITRFSDVTQNHWAWAAITEAATSHSYMQDENGLKHWHD